MTANPQPMHLRFTVEEYYQMYEMGILKYYERAEIIGGELFKKSSIGDLHATVVNFLSKFFLKNVFDGIRVGVQNPVRLSDYDEPEPDLALSDLTKYSGKRHPRPEEVLLIVKVSDTTLSYDRKTKIPLYAEASIPEVWLINLKNQTVQVYTNPLEGAFGFVRVLHRGEVLESETVPNLSLNVDTIFG